MLPHWPTERFESSPSHPRLGLVNQHYEGIFSLSLSLVDYLAWQSPDSMQYVYQTLALHTGNDDDESYRAVVNARSPSSDYKTVVDVGLWYRPIVHVQPANGCSYPDGIANPNGWKTSRSDYQKLVGTGSTRVYTNWQAVATSWRDPTEDTDGFLFQVRVYGFAMAQDGSMGPVLLDNVRGEGT